MTELPTLGLVFVLAESDSFTVAPFEQVACPRVGYRRSSTSAGLIPRSGGVVSGSRRVRCAGSLESLALSTLARAVAEPLRECAARGSALQARGRPRPGLQAAGPLPVGCVEAAARRCQPLARQVRVPGVGCAGRRAAMTRRSPGVPPARHLGPGRLTGVTPSHKSRGSSWQFRAHVPVASVLLALSAAEAEEAS